MAESKNDIAWNAFFEKYNVLEEVAINGFVRVRAKDMVEFREPRLMAKLDHSNNLPVIFRKNSLGILPVTRGDYIISSINTYHKFEYNPSKVIYKGIPSYIQSLSVTDIFNEPVAISISDISGILSDFLEVESSTIYSTVSGRMGSDLFSFNINKISGGSLTVTADRVQIEIDAAYESRDFLAVIEAKNQLSEDFIVRQLYYPYRVWRNRVSKRIRPVYMVYSNDIFNLYEYAFSDYRCYDSIHLIKHKRYCCLDDPLIKFEDLVKLAKDTQSVSSDITFPQADTFDRVINLCELILLKGSVTKLQISDKYDFTPRQADYYISAGMYLGLIAKYQKGVYNLTREGRGLLSLDYRSRQLAFCECILKSDIFNKAFLDYAEHGRINKFLIVSLIKCKYPSFSDETSRRRSDTATKWIEWMRSLCTD